MSLLEKKNTAVVFGLTANHTFAVASVMMDLKKYSPDLADEIVIFHNGIKESDQMLLQRIIPTRFIKYNFPITDTSIFNQNTLRYFSKMVFSKYECLRLLEEYKNVIWLDYDIVIIKDISELITPSASGIKMMLSPGRCVSEQLHEPIDDYDMHAVPICGSTFVFQDNLKDYLKLYNFCIESLRKYAKYLSLGEQAIFDFMIQEYDLNLEHISHTQYSPHPTDELSPNTKILHAFGQPKFWNGINNIQWNENYKNWLNMGGSKYKAETKIKHILKTLYKRFAK